MSWDTILRRLKSVATATSKEKAARIGTFEASATDIGPRAKKKEVATAESELGAPLPASLRDAFLNLSGDIDVSWTLGWSRNEDDERRFIAWGEVKLSVTSLPEIHGRKEALLAGPGAGLYGAHWRRPLAFMKFGGGDFLAIDVQRGVGDGPVIYLAKNGSEADGALLGGSFADFMDRWTRLACVGPDYAYSKYFLTEEGLDPAGSNALAWRALLGLEGLK
jgi:cell wall assembly regulator SMI1